jgi:hypothetical protein
MMTRRPASAPLSAGHRRIDPPHPGLQLEALGKAAALRRSDGREIDNELVGRAALGDAAVAEHHLLNRRVVRET